MDWGKGILLSIIAFIAIIMTMVVISVRMEGIELVTDNYYEEEIKYQDRIDDTNSTLELNREVLTFEAASKSVLLDLPVGSKGTLNLFRPSERALDQELAVFIEDEGMKRVSIDHLKAGYWKVQLSWTENGKSYYQEKKITI
ncbi:MAG: FixH family protein [Bacteroidota bacterium]|uniref:FixH protein n=1 Tax=Algoriphagus faecimaris TaxID=686796 RepID=A0A1G6SGL2_9BACT|nr:FixH family protein [Algoriphagus faecimaris]SDD16052.1 FixH protein [Algoriphagus faecimaris]